MTRVISVPSLLYNRVLGSWLEQAGPSSRYTQSFKNYQTLASGTYVSNILCDERGLVKSEKRCHQYDFAFENWLCVSGGLCQRFLVVALSGWRHGSRRAQQIRFDNSPRTHTVDNYGCYHEVRVTPWQKVARRRGRGALLGYLFLPFSELRGWKPLPPARTAAMGGVTDR